MITRGPFINDLTRIRALKLIEKYLQENPTIYFGMISILSTFDDRIKTNDKLKVYFAPKIMDQVGLV